MDFAFSVVSHQFRFTSINYFPQRASRAVSWFYISAVLRALWEGVEDRFFRGALRAPQNCVHVDHDGLCYLPPAGPLPAYDLVVLRFSVAMFVLGN